MAARRWETIPVLLLMALLGWRALRELALYAEVRDAPAAGVLDLPLVWFWAPAGLAVVAVGAMGIHAALFGRDARRVRLSYIAVFLVFTLDAFLLPPTRLPPLVSSDLIAQSALEQLRAQILARGAAGRSEARLPETIDALEAALEGSPAPYLARGEKVGWKIVLQRACEAPVLDPGGRPPGTIFYCLSQDRRTGVLSVVGTGGRLSGPAVMALTPEGPVVVRVQLPSSEAASNLEVRPDLGARHERGVGRIDADKVAEIPSNGQEPEIH